MDIVYYLEKNKESNKLIPFKFTESDFYSEYGNYKYDGEESKLPWQDITYMIKSLDKVNKLIYKYSRWNEVLKSYEIKTLTANVNTNLEEMKLEIDYIFYGYDRYNLPKDTEFPSNVDYTSP
ncbi:hypothetical protein C7377_0834 [Balneicella halophila]|uniref:Uncharacterized protein n=1 Tax=Balneicella halophila TaxID=1537566 RepID=A0A7L4URX8_BALHA|nr:hypothetical protein [Balneicella halophila]PVX52510.1 hypothetical protein C7377_0834 [Balneicella halophila]